MKNLTLLLPLLAAINMYGQVTSVDGTFNAYSTSNLSLQTNGTTRLTILNTNGYVGIGNAPTEAIDVNGTARLRSIPQNSGLPRLLVSDAEGRIFWRDVSSLSVTPSIFPYLIIGGNIGVGSGALINASTVASQNAAVGFQSLYSNTDGSINSAFGYQSLYSNTTGHRNVSVGTQALYSNTTGYYNTAIGASSLFSNTSGTSNTAIGYLTLYYNTTGVGNSANGNAVLKSNTTGSHNTASGNAALSSNTQGGQNTAIGGYALSGNTTGNSNTASGFSSLGSNTTGSYNVANGAYALRLNSIGVNNVASGYSAMFYNTTGNANVANGNEALILNATGSSNVASGYRALYNNTTGSNNTSIGSNSLNFNLTGGNNTALGYNAGTNSGDLTNTTALGSNTIVTASNQVRIGNSYVTSIGGQVSWSTLSDGRFKRDIKENVSGLDFINQLRPVTYIVDTDAYDTFLGIPDSLRQKQSSARKAAIRQTGFIAQEVEAAINKTGFVFHGVEVPQNENDHYSIRYAEFVVPLVKAVQELTAKAEAQQKKIDLLLNQLNKSNQINQELLSDGAILLFQNAPNPFTEGTDIKMILPEDVHQANLIIYNLEGKQLKSVPVQTRGNAVVKFAGPELSAGIYIYTLIADGKIIDTKKMILTK